MPLDHRTLPARYRPNHDPIHTVIAKKGPRCDTVTIGQVARSHEAPIGKKPSLDAAISNIQNKLMVHRFHGSGICLSSPPLLFAEASSAGGIAKMHGNQMVP